MEEVKDIAVPLDAEGQRAFDEVQKEKADLGIPGEPEVKSPVETPPVEAPKETPKEEVKDEPKEVSIKEEKEEKFFDRKEKKTYKEQLRESFEKEYSEKLEKIKAEQSKSKPDETKSEKLEDDVTALAKELDFDPTKMQKLIEVARKGLQLSDEQKQALEQFKTIKAEREAEEQEKIFNSEWNTLPIKQQFPNASEEQMKAARERMEELAFSEKYHEMDMDYILFKEKAEFDKLLFSPKQKTFESGKFTPSETETEEFPEFRPGMTPAEFASFEKRREKATEDLGRDKVLIRTTDDGGRVVERWE